MHKNKPKGDLARPRHPHTLSRQAQHEQRRSLQDEGFSLRDADSIVSGSRRAAHGASPPFMPGDTGKGARRKR